MIHFDPRPAARVVLAGREVCAGLPRPPRVLFLSSGCQGSVCSFPQLPLLSPPSLLSPSHRAIIGVHASTASFCQHDHVGEERTLRCDGFRRSWTSRDHRSQWWRGGASCPHSCPLMSCVFVLLFNCVLTVASESIHCCKTVQIHKYPRWLWKNSEFRVWILLCVNTPWRHCACGSVNWTLVSPLHTTQSSIWRFFCSIKPKWQKSLITGSKVVSLILSLWWRRDKFQWSHFSWLVVFFCSNALQQ